MHIFLYLGYLDHVFGRINDFNECYCLGTLKFILFFLFRIIIMYVMGIYFLGFCELSYKKYILFYFYLN